MMCCEWSPGEYKQNFFLFITHEWPNKLECFALAGLSSLVLCFLVRPGAYLRGGTRKVSHLQTRLNRPAWDKHSSSFGSFISDEIFLWMQKLYFVLNTVLGRIKVDWLLLIGLLEYSEALNYSRHTGITVRYHAIQHYTGCLLALPHA